MLHKAKVAVHSPPSIQRMARGGPSMRPLALSWQTRQSTMVALFWPTRQSTMALDEAEHGGAARAKRQPRGQARATYLSLVRQCVRAAHSPGPLSGALDQPYADRSIPRVHECNVLRAAKERSGWSKQVQALLLRGLPLWSAGPHKTLWQAFRPDHQTERQQHGISTVPH